MLIEPNQLSTEPNQEKSQSLLSLWILLGMSISKGDPTQSKSSYSDKHLKRNNREQSWVNKNSHLKRKQGFKSQKR